MVGHVTDHGLPHGRRGHEPVVLGQDADAQESRAHDPARIRVSLPGQELEQGALARAVAADDPDPLSGRHPEADAVQQDTGAEGGHHRLHRDQDTAHQVALIGADSAGGIPRFTRTRQGRSHGHRRPGRTPAEPPGRHPSRRGSPPGLRSARRPARERRRSARSR